MKTTRRQFLGQAATGSVFLALGNFMPGLLGSRLLADEAGGSGRALVVLELAGGNDGLNTVVPLQMDGYHRARPTLALRSRDCHALTDGFGLHPALTGLKELYDQGSLGIVHGVGYPNPDRSHFRSMEIWHTARPEVPADAERTGWLGRYLDAQIGEVAPGKLPAIAFGRTVPKALAAARTVVPALRDPARFGYQTSGEEGRILKALLGGTCEAEGSAATDPLAAVRAAARGALLTAEDMHRLQDGYKAAVPYPDTPLGRSLRYVAQMLVKGFDTRIFYLGMGGFDTHAGQGGTHRRLLQSLGDALLAFQKDLADKQTGREVAVLVTSEFGRRVEENASAGTDHGAAGPVLVIGSGVRAGLHGTHPRLDALERGDIRYTCDFRRVYATVLADWLGADARAVLGQSFERLPLFPSTSSD